MSAVECNSFIVLDEGNILGGVTEVGPTFILPFEKLNNFKAQMH